LINVLALCDLEYLVVGKALVGHELDFGKKFAVDVGRLELKELVGAEDVLYPVHCALVHYRHRQPENGDYSASCKA